MPKPTPAQIKKVNAHNKRVQAKQASGSNLGLTGHSRARVGYDPVYAASYERIFGKPRRAQRAR